MRVRAHSHHIHCSTKMLCSENTFYVKVKYNFCNANDLNHCCIAYVSYLPLGYLCHVPDKKHMQQYNADLIFFLLQYMANWPIPLHLPHMFADTSPKPLPDQLVFQNLSELFLCSYL